MRTPPRTLGFGKDEVRALAALGVVDLGQAGRPVPGQPHPSRGRSHPFRLARIDRAEVAVRTLLASRDMTVHDLCVRDLGAARVEIDADLVAAVADDADLVAAVRDAGVTGDIAVAAFSSGALSREATHR